MQELEKRELQILRELVAANVLSNLEAPGLDGTERSRKWHELREIQESIANKKQRVVPPENGLRQSQNLEETREGRRYPLRHELGHCGRE